MRFLVRCNCCFHHMASYRKSFESESGRWGRRCWRQWRRVGWGRRRNLDWFRSGRSKRWPTGRNGRRQSCRPRWSRSPQYFVASKPSPLRRQVL